MSLGRARKINAWRQLRAVASELKSCDDMRLLDLKMLAGIVERNAALLIEDDRPGTTDEIERYRSPLFGGPLRHRA